MKPILITGASGNVGSRIVKKLAAAGHEVRAFDRGKGVDPGANVEVVVGDYDDAASVAKAVDGVDVLYLLSAGPDLARHEANVIAAAKKAGVKRIVKHSVAGAQYGGHPIANWHQAGEKLLAESGVAWTVLRPGSFASNALMWADSVRAQSVAYGNLGDASLPVIDPNDIADVAVKVLTTSGHEGKAYDLTGPESLTSAQQAELLGAAVGRKVSFVNVPDEAAKDAMSKMGMPPVFVDAMLQMIGALRGIGRLEPTGDVEKLLGRKPGTFADWAKANAAAFK